MREKIRNNALSPTEIRSLNPPILHPAELQFSKLNTAYIHIEFFPVWFYFTKQDI